MELLLAAVLLLVIILLTRLVLVRVNKQRFIRYWHQQLAARVPAEAVKLVVLGNSISIGVGASSHKTGLAGLAAAYISERTGRPVHVQNYSRSGAVASEVRYTQLPKVSFAEADVIMLEIGTNDARRQQTPEQYRADMEHILAQLPLRKTVVADIPLVKARERFQAELEGVLHNKAVARANIEQAFRSVPNTRLVTAGDFFHPNDKGYRLWFNAFRPGIDQVLQHAGLLKTEAK